MHDSLNEEWFRRLTNATADPLVIEVAKAQIRCICLGLGVPWTYVRRSLERRSEISPIPKVPSRGNFRPTPEVGRTDEEHIAIAKRRLAETLSVQIGHETEIAELKRRLNEMEPALTEDQEGLVADIISAYLREMYA